MGAAPRLSRRAIIAGLVASATPARAEGRTTYLSSGLLGDGTPLLCGLSDFGTRTYHINVPNPGHGGAAHPRRQEAVVFPVGSDPVGLIIDTDRGTDSAWITLPHGRHFSGHGAFSSDASRLYAPEIETRSSLGFIGIWDTTNGYRRLGAFPSGGYAPHDVLLLHRWGVIALAHEGTERHRANISYIDPAGRLLERFDLPAGLESVKIEHLALTTEGNLAFTMQGKNETSANHPTLGVRRESGRLDLFVGPGPPADVAVNAGRLAATYPSENLCQVFEGQTQHAVHLPKVRSVASHVNGFMFSSKSGRISVRGPTSDVAAVEHRHQWVGHLLGLNV